jgi:hypothetical protein
MYHSRVVSAAHRYGLPGGEGGRARDDIKHLGAWDSGNPGLT